MKPATILCLILLWSSHHSLGQSLNTALISKDTIAFSNKRFAFLESSTQDGQTAMKGLFYFYKRFISSQDGQSCRYSPSCSEYAFLSIKKHGILVGVIDFFDRFSRCNPLSPENYTLDIDKHLFLDPIE